MKRCAARSPRVMAALHKQYNRLRLRINEDKSVVARASERKFLGLSFWGGQGTNHPMPSSKTSQQAMKGRVRHITRRTGGRSLA